MEKLDKSKPSKQKYTVRTLQLMDDWWPVIDDLAAKEMRSRNNYLEILIGQAIGKLPKN